MKRILFGLIFCTATGSVPALAADSDGAYWSQRPASCREFRSALGSDARTPALLNMRNWIAGYLTAYNRQTPNTYDILGISEFDAAMQSIENFCKAHPLDNVSDAMEAVTEQFYAKRHQTKRQAGR